MDWIRTIQGRPMIWRGHRCERANQGGAFRYRTLCGLDAPSVTLSCHQDEACDCMTCALTLDQEKIDALKGSAQ